MINGWLVSYQVLESSKRYHIFSEAFTGITPMEKPHLVQTVRSGVASLHTYLF